MKLLFKKGALFYAEYNLRLLIHLLIEKADILVANDLDTLPAVYAASRIKKIPVVYDSHEYFTEVPELIGRKWVKRFWEVLESFLLPRIKFAYTVSDSISREYLQKYGIAMQVVRNLPFKIAEKQHPEKLLRNGNEKIIICQGSLNMGRGLELAIRAMQFIDGTRLVIAGTGDVENKLHELTRYLGLQEKVSFLGRILPEELTQYTSQADLGISLEEMLGLNYYYALPNKLFDYIQARIPVLVSDLPEMAAVVRQYDIGMVNHTHDPHELALILTEMLINNSKRQIWQKNLDKAAAELCWENEEPILNGIYRKVIAGESHLF